MMQPNSSFARNWWLAPLLVVLAALSGLGFVKVQHTPAGAIAAPAPTAPVPYVSSDPSVPPAASVRLPDAEPHIEAF